MFRNKLKLKFLGIILVLLFVVTGCLGGPAKRVEQTADEVEVQRLHELIFTAEDLQSLLHHLADPFALGGGRAWGEQEPEMKWETYTHQEAMNFQQDTGARFPLPLGPPPEGWTMLDPAVMVNGEHATVSQVAETVRQTGTNPDDEIRTIQVKRHYISSWSKRKGEWRLTEFSTASILQCVANCEFDDSDDVDVDASSVEEVYGLLFTAQNAASLLKHFADSFDVSITYIVEGQTLSNSGTLTREDVLFAFPGDWYRGLLPIGDPPEGTKAGELQIHEEGDAATTAQEFERQIELSVDPVNDIAAIVSERTSIESAWVKDSNRWYLTELSITVDYQCVTNCDRLGNI